VGWYLRHAPPEQNRDRVRRTTQSPANGVAAVVDRFFSRYSQRIAAPLHVRSRAVVSQSVLVSGQLIKAGLVLHAIGTVSGCEEVSGGIFGIGNEDDNVVASGPAFNAIVHYARQNWT
jgi:hypothetical protein